MIESIRAVVTHRWTVRACQIAIGAIFAYAALNKLGDLPAFAKQIHNFRILPVAAENLVAMTLPWMEIVAALALILGVRARSGGVVVAGMLAVFTVAVILAILRGLSIECGCFGKASASTVGAVKVAQNLGMLALALIASVRARP